MFRLSAIHRLLHKLIGPPRPTGLMSWRYFWPPALRDPRVLAHRRLWFAARDDKAWTIWLAREALGWLRWICWYGWTRAFRSVAVAGPQVLADERVAIEVQRRAALDLAFGWCVPARQTYDFSLYRQPDKALDYIYDCETAAYHRTRATGDVHRVTAMLGDKQAAAAWLSGLRVKMVPTLTCAPRGASLSIDSVLGSNPAIFCKMRAGHRGLGAFAVWRTERGLAGHRFQGAELADAVAVQKAWRALLARDDALVQPLLRNHPEIAPIAPRGGAITLRYVSQRDADGVSCFCATLEATGGPAPEDGGFYPILPLNSEGMLTPLPSYVSALWYESYQAARARAPGLTSVPHWGEIVDATHRAHQAIPELWGVAWDWVVTPEGPLLLEGNAYWGLATPQLLKGPALYWR